MSISNDTLLELIKEEPEGFGGLIGVNPYSEENKQALRKLIDEIVEELIFVNDIYCC